MRIAGLFFLIVCFFACSDSRFIEMPVVKENCLRKLFDDYWDERMRLYPLEATQNGDARFNHLLTISFTDSFRDTLSTFYLRYLQTIQKFKREALEENDRISYDIFKREMEIQLEGLKYPTHHIPFNQFWGLPLDMGQLGSGQGSQPFLTFSDYQNWIQRARSFSAWTDSAIIYFKKGIEKGVVLPKALVIKMIPQMKELANADSSKNIFFGPLQQLPQYLSSAEKDSIRAFLPGVIRQHLITSYKKLAHFLEHDYLPQGRTSTGIGSLPNGAETYTYLARLWTTTSLSPDEIYKTGLSEVKKIKNEMERIKDSIGFTGDMNAFFHFMKTNKRFMPYKSPQEILTAFKEIQKRMDPYLKNMFIHTPKTPLQVKQTEAYRVASASAEYQQGTSDGGRPGIFYVPIINAASFNTSGMESLFLHEATPGHHYQISLQLENESLPMFRRYAWYGAFGEGWALYCESMGKELGLYTDPYQYMGALADEMLRAIRLIVDVGIHTKNMSREQAIEFMTGNQPISNEAAAVEIERYMAIPGQALSYKIGALKIKELRNKYEKQLGNRFELAAFHDELLKDGVMPLEIAEQKMDAWAKKIIAGE